MRSLSASTTLFLFLITALGALAGCANSTTGADGDGGVGGGDGGGGDGGGAHCVIKDPACGTACTGDDGCPSGLYCGSGVCRADCTPEGGQCTTGVCVRGRCDADCPSVTVALEPVVPTVVLLIDQSGSMNSAFSEQTSRWDALKNALTDPNEGVLPALESRVRFGATLYTSDGGSAGGKTCPVVKELAPAADTAAEIETLLDANNPVADTPTGESIDAVVAAYPGYAVPADSPRVIVLATDGEPDTCAQPNPQEGQSQSVAATQSAFTAGIRTYVLSVGTDTSEQHLQDVANAGVGLPVDGTTNAPFWVANDPAALVSHFNEIIRGVRSCNVNLDGQVVPEHASSGIVKLNGTTLIYEDADGWRLVDEDTLELLGAACTTFRESDAAELTAEFPCGTVLK